jgi:hypothetical protein
VTASKGNSGFSMKQQLFGGGSGKGGSANLVDKTWKRMKM